jgi:tetratricopeptide (TPR) repeat protein
MKDWIHLPAAAAVAALVGAGSAFMAAPARESRGADTDLRGLETALRELESEQRALATRLAELPAGTGAAPASSRVAARDVDAAVAEFLAKELGRAPDPLGADDGDLRDASRADAERILSGTLSEGELEALWQELRDQKRIDAVLAEIEQQAALAPHDPDLQSELGKAYLQKLFDDGIGPMAAVWGEKADGAFDRALALDDRHWEARFQKALALSNWPAFLGKQGESVRQFEILMDQQERGAASAEQAWTYFFLGNLYHQGGDREKAQATWRRGASRFPDSAQLRAKTEGR